jgi:hypothetical protein
MTEKTEISQFHMANPDYPIDNPEAPTGKPGLLTYSLIN